jgi:bacterial/archaeal transporter family protein
MSFRGTAQPETTRKQKIPPWLVFPLLTIVLWGVWGATSKLVTNQISPYLYQVLFTIGLIPLLPLVVRSQGSMPPAHRKRGIFYAFCTGILGGTGNITFYMSLAAGGKASIVVPATALSPLVTVVLAFLILKERVTGSQKLGLLLALGAIYLLSL